MLGTLFPEQISAPDHAVTLEAPSDYRILYQISFYRAIQCVDFTILMYMVPDKLSFELSKFLTRSTLSQLERSRFVANYSHSLLDKD